MKKMHRVRRLGVVAALLGLGCVMLLLVDYGIALVRAPGEKSRVEELVKQVKTDPEAAVELHEERERQTLASMARETRSRVAAWASDCDARSQNRIVCDSPAARSKGPTLRSAARSEAVEI